MKYIEYKEQKTHGTTDVPIAFYHLSSVHPRYEMSYHWHMEYELIRILEGSLLFKMNEQEFTAQAGDVIFLHDGILHGAIPLTCIYECVVFDFPTLCRQNPIYKKQLKHIVAHALLVTPFFPDAKEPLCSIVSELFETMSRKPDGYELTALGCFYQFFGYVLEHHHYSEAPSFSSNNEKRINQMKNALLFIETFYQNAISLDDLARAAGMNSKYFCRFFREMTHRTPIDYLNYYRVERACFELAVSDASITEVSLNCGFNDVSYFIKTFKKHKGLTPKKYLKSALCDD